MYEMKTKTKLSANPPARLKGFKTAREAWKIVIRLCRKHGDEILSAFDEGALETYCHIIEDEKNWIEEIARYKKAMEDFEKMRSEYATDKLFQKTMKQMQKIQKDSEAIPAKKRKLSQRLAFDLFVSNSLRQEIETEMEKLINE